MLTAGLIGRVHMRTNAPGRTIDIKDVRSCEENHSLREHHSRRTQNIMTNYQKMVDEAAGLLRTKSTWAGLQPEHVARMRLQNQFKTGLDVAKYTAKIMRKDMEDYDRDNT